MSKISPICFVLLLFQFSVHQGIAYSDTDFFGQWTRLQQTENELLRNYVSYLKQTCNDSTGSKDVLQPDVLQPLGPNDFHIVPPGPTQSTRIRPLGQSEPHIVQPGPTQSTRIRQPNVHPVRPEDRHVVPPGPTREPRYRPLRRSDPHLVPTVPTQLDPGHRQPDGLQPLGPYDRHILPPGPTQGPIYRSTMGPRDRNVIPSREVSPCCNNSRGPKGEPGFPGITGLPGQSGFSRSDLRDLMAQRGAQLCIARYQQCNV